MFIHVSHDSLKYHHYDDVLREACAQLSAQGIDNFIHYSEPRMIEITATHEWCVPEIDMVLDGVWLFTAATQHCQL